MAITTPLEPVSKLRLRCRRGMLELDLMLNHYLTHHYPHADIEEQTQFIDLLTMQDPQLYQMLLNQTFSDPPLLQKIRKSFAPS
ncbi:MAG TPA: succinate dehydrogenase assembly factor 2 [Gammaproteobacteria bacterium]|jgi:antitoxin CptB|nr:succinate dehydrogenase assembly factor 2 [Gammaproteobacteria bacterium]HIJ34486.1 succinate dehydrogenase assembly factor 2 [Gammaproteobacteria bacterium]